MSYYRHHVFFCTNLRGDDSPCCGRCHAAAARDYRKRRAQELGLTGPGGVRINVAGCLERCALGPALVVYPETVRYTYIDEADVADILQSHPLGGTPVARLRVPA